MEGYQKEYTIKDVIIITITNRQKTDKQNHTMVKKEKGDEGTDRQTDGRTDN